MRRFAGRLPRRMTPGAVTPWTALGSRTPVAPPDLDTTRRSWERAGNAGDIAAMNSLGRLYAQRLEPPDLDAARRWFERAADAGHTDAACHLGYLYAERLEPPDLAAARRWFERAAEAGNSDAMYRLMLLRADAQRVWWRHAGRWTTRRRRG